MGHEYLVRAGACSAGTLVGEWNHILVECGITFQWNVEKHFSGTWNHISVEHGITFQWNVEKHFSGTWKNILYLRLC